MIEDVLTHKIIIRNELHLGLNRKIVMLRGLFYKRKVQLVSISFDSGKYEQNFIFHSTEVKRRHLVKIEAMCFNKKYNETIYFIWHFVIALWILPYQ